MMSVGVCILFLLIPSLTHSYVRENPNDSGNDATFTDYYPRKRVQRGVSALAAFLRSAKLVILTKNYRLYQKSGGLKQANKDFDSLVPMSVREGGADGHYLKRGRVDNTKVEIKTALEPPYRKGQPELNILSRNIDGTPIRRRIQYEN